MSDNYVVSNNEIEIITAYDEALKLSERLVEHAEKGEWDNLLELESHYLIVIEKLTHLTKPIETEQPLQENLITMLRIIIDNEQKTKILLQSKLDNLSKNIKQTEQQRIVHKSYGQFDDSEYIFDIKPLNKEK